MKVHLLHPDRDLEVKRHLRDQTFDAMLSGNLYALANVRRKLERELAAGSATTKPSEDDSLIQDLELDTLCSAMAGGNEFLFETAKRVVLSGLSDPDEIVYRQQVLADCLAQPDVVGRLYELAIDALAGERRVGGLWSGARPSSVLHRSVQQLTLYAEALRRLRQIADEHSEAFRSTGFTRFFAMVRTELSDEYLEEVAYHLRELELKRGVLESAELGTGDRGCNYLFHQPREQRGSWWTRLGIGGRAEGYSFELHPRDESGFRALDQIKARAINVVADGVAQSVDHVRSFFTVLRVELAFYLGCLNLHHRLRTKGEAVCFPEPDAGDRTSLAARGLYDVCLTLHLEASVVGNDLDADGRSLVMITGANQGGKSTLLRSLGLAQLMMQSGMFVCAEAFHAGVCSGVYTHYKREEDTTMQGGKLDEELSRMSEIADRIAPGAILLCNESFASTNEREGSAIAREVIRAMLDRHIRVFFVTHLYDLAHGLYAQRLPGALFLRAERERDGRRTFRLRPGAPLPTSHGEDSYRRIFGGERDAAASA
jgi:MutS domain V